MKILITGANGFVGKNLIAQLRNEGYTDLLTMDSDTSWQDATKLLKQCEFFYHLAGSNRPKDISEFKIVNTDLTKSILAELNLIGNKCPIMYASSIQADIDNDYGQSKKLSEEILLKHSENNGSKVFIYRFPNIFGKWSRPNYNSAVATFCHNIAHGLPIMINNAESIVNLVYIDDVVKLMINLLKMDQVSGFQTVEPIYNTTVGDLVYKIESFAKTRSNLSVPNCMDSFEKKLYSTYLSFLPKEEFSYHVKMNIDARGSFTEIFKFKEHGQLSVNVTQPGITKGNHWHHTKHEKFMVVSGTGIIRFRDVWSNEILEYRVSGAKLEMVEIPPGYTHNIQNFGDTDLVTLMWVNEELDKENTDTYFLEV